MVKVTIFPANTFVAGRDIKLPVKHVSYVISIRKAPGCTCIFAFGINGSVTKLGFHIKTCRCKHVF